MEDYSKHRSNPSTQIGYQVNIDRNIIPILGRMSKDGYSSSKHGDDLEPP